VKDSNKEEKLGKLPLRERITEIRKRTEQEPESMISEEEIGKFNNMLQAWKKLAPNDPFLTRITPLRFGAVALDLYLRISLLSEFITGLIEETQEEIKRHKREIDTYTRLLKAFKKMLYGERNQLSIHPQNASSDPHLSSNKVGSLGHPHHEPAGAPESGPQFYPNSGFKPII